MGKSISESLELQSLILHHKLSGPHHFSDEEKLAIIRAYLKDHIPLKDLCKEFNVCRMTIWRWISNYSDKNQSYNKETIVSEVTQSLTPMPKKNQNPAETPEEELARLREENRKLQEALKMAEWSNHAKDVMIDIAEKTFNIPIRKKPGAKQ